MLVKVFILAVICDFALVSSEEVKVLKRHSYYNTSEYELTLDNVGLETIEPEAFHDASVYNLVISGNPLKELKKGIFTNLSTHGIYLYDNRIRTIEPGIFNDLTPLENYGIMALSLSGNRLQAIQKGIFTNTLFRELALNSNIISHIEPGAFEGMPHLLKIDLNGNRLSRIDTGVFQSLTIPTSWVRLNFRNNKIKYVDPYAFENSTLYDLDLQDNNLKDVIVKYFRKTTIGNVYV